MYVYVGNILSYRQILVYASHFVFRAKYFVINTRVFGTKQTDDGVNKSTCYAAVTSSPALNCWKSKQTLMRLIFYFYLVGNISLPPQTEAGEPSIIGL
jgi:hypothetical protein